MIFNREMSEGLAVITIDRPPVNAISSDFIDQLHALSRELAQDDAVRAVLFRSDIPGRFIAGADLAGILQQDVTESLQDRMRRLNREWRSAFYALESIPHITIAAIGGHCLGGGLEFALCCDYRLMVDDGKSCVGLTEMNLGLFPGAGGTVRLPRLVGVARAKDLIYRGRRLLAPEARAMGLVHECWGPDQFQAEALQFARQLAQGPTLAQRAAKAAIQAGLTAPLQADQLEEDGFVAIAQTDDALEGLTAFWEKRPAQFKGR